MLSLRLFSIPAAPALCSTSPITTAMTFMYRGYRRLGAVKEFIKARSVGPSFAVMPFYADTFLVLSYALSLSGPPDVASQRPPSLVSVIDSQRLNDASSSSPLRVIADSTSSFHMHETSVETDRREGSRSTMVLSPKRRNVSPVSGMGCDGWCMYNINPRATVVSTDLAW
jgi:hypothetical protein